VLAESYTKRVCFWIWVLEVLQQCESVGGLKREHLREPLWILALIRGELFYIVEPQALFASLVAWI
jgi:hypothetical protein